MVLRKYQRFLIHEDIWVLSSMIICLISRISPPERTIAFGVVIIDIVRGTQSASWIIMTAFTAWPAMTPSFGEGAVKA